MREFVIGENDVKRLRALLSAFESGRLTTDTGYRANDRGWPIEVNAGICNVAIAAHDFGDVTVHRVDADDNWQPTDQIVTAYDWGGSGFAENDPVALVRISSEYGIRWVAIPTRSDGGLGERVRWGICQQNWSKIGSLPSDGGRARVTIKECDDSVGTNPHGDNIVVYLPINSGGDPNLVAGDVIAWTVSVNTTPVCVSSYMDSPVGTVQMFTGSSAQIRPGWKCMNGSQGAGKVRGTDENGNPYNMVDRFPQAQCSDGQTGRYLGSETHDHGGITGDASPDTTASDTGITVSDHTDHSHLINDPNPQADLPEGGTQFFQMGCTSGVKSAASCYTDAEPGVLGHEVYDPTHYHTVEAHAHEIPASSHYPPYLTIRFIERIDNSA